MKLITRKDSKLQGLQRYFTAVPCKRGHVVERLVANCACIECAKITNSKHDSTDRGKETRRTADRKYTKTANGKQVHKHHFDEYEQTTKGRAIRKKIRQRYVKNNPDKNCARVNKYRLLKLQAVPKWANQEKIQEYYTQAALLTKTTDILHEVDHIIPINGKTVCGLHCEDNLQVLTKYENGKKSNKLKE